MGAIAIFIAAFALLVQADPLGLYQQPKYQPPTTLQRLQTEWWSAEFAASLTSDNKAHDCYLAQARTKILRESLSTGVSPEEVFGNANEAK